MIDKFVFHRFAFHQDLRRLSPICLAAALVACGNLPQRAEGVRVTVSRAAVEPCTNVGFVALGSQPFDRDDAYQQLRQQVITRNGNTLLVNSYSGATSGTAYACVPPLSWDDPRVEPTGKTGPL